MFVILCRNAEHDREWEYCDRADSKLEAERLMREYQLAFGFNWEFLITMERGEKQ